jgi:hypothetical protein
VTKHPILFVQSKSDEDKKSFMTFTPGVNVIKLFFFHADGEAK